MHDHDVTRGRVHAVAVPPGSTPTQIDITAVRASIGPNHTAIAFTADASSDRSSAAIARAATVLEAHADVDAVCTTLPVTDAIKRVRDGIIVETVDRDTLRWIDFPVVIRAAALRAALDLANRTGTSHVNLVAGARSIRELPQ